MPFRKPASGKKSFSSREERAPRSASGKKRFERSEDSDRPKRNYGANRTERPRTERPSSGGYRKRSENSGGPRDGRTDARPGRSREGFQNREKPYAPRTLRSDEPGEFRQPRKKSAYFGKPYGPPTSRKPRFDGDRQDEKSFVQSRLKRQRKFIGRKRSDEDVKKNPDETRLNKYIANSGICSRREADNLISMGLVAVNGQVITEMGYKVKRGDEVRYEGKKLTAEKPVYILLNKPKGFITTTDDPQERNTVMNLIAGACKERVYPVGRLDRNTTGLLLFTNDGELADRLTHPSYNVRKIYKVELDRPLTKADFEKIKSGVRLEEGKAVVDDVAIVGDDGKTIGIELHIGWNRIVRRIFESLDYQIERLDRVVYAGLDKKELPRGNWRFLKEAEIVKLKHFNKPTAQDSLSK
jgi:23S rRNA pseudouridine2605 synthase